MPKEKIKLDNDSQLFIKKPLRDVVNPRNGRIITQYVKTAVKKDISLGSLKNPKNEDIVEFDWKDVSQPDINSIMRGFFRRFGG